MEVEDEKGGVAADDGAWSDISDDNENEEVVQVETHFVRGESQPVDLIRLSQGSDSSGLCDTVIVVSELIKKVKACLEAAEPERLSAAAADDAEAQRQIPEPDDAEAQRQMPEPGDSDPDVQIILSLSDDDEEPENKEPTVVETDWNPHASVLTGWDPRWMEHLLLQIQSCNITQCQFMHDLIKKSKGGAMELMLKDKLRGGGGGFGQQFDLLLQQYCVYGNTDYTKDMTRNVMQIFMDSKTKYVDEFKAPPKKNVMVATTTIHKNSAVPKQRQPFEMFAGTQFRNLPSDISIAGLRGEMVSLFTKVESTLCIELVQQHNAQTQNNSS